MPRKGKRTKRASTPKEVDLGRVEKTAAEGVWQPSQVADVLGLSRTELLNSSTKDAVLEAIERGKAKHFQNSLREYRAAIKSKNGNLSALLIFQLKQHGWTDRVNLNAEGGFQLELQGATERFFAMFNRFMRKQTSEA